MREHHLRGVELDLLRDAIVGRLLPLMVQGGVIAHRLAEAGSLDLGTGNREAWVQGYYARDDGTVLRGGSTSRTSGERLTPACGRTRGTPGLQLGGAERCRLPGERLHVRLVGDELAVRAGVSVLERGHPLRLLD
jgi:hypothetical protein